MVKKYSRLYKIFSRRGVEPSVREDAKGQ